MVRPGGEGAQATSRQGRRNVRRRDEHLQLSGSAGDSAGDKYAVGDLCAVGQVQLSQGEHGVHGNKVAVAQVCAEA